jgi:hypothetical protein
MMELQVQVLFCLSSSDARDKEGGTLVFQAHYYDTPFRAQRTVVPRTIFPPFGLSSPKGRDTKKDCMCLELQVCILD